MFSKKIDTYASGTPPNRKNACSANPHCEANLRYKHGQNVQVELTLKNSGIA